MGLLDFLRRPDINEGAARWASTPGALLLDVRTPAEFREGHIPGSRNLPLDQIRRAEEVAAERETPLFLYCASGARSGAAARQLRYFYAFVSGGGMSLIEEWIKGGMADSEEELAQAAEQIMVHGMGYFEHGTGPEGG